MPLVRILGIVIDYVIPEVVAAAVIEGTTVITSAATGAVISIGVPRSIAAGLITVGGDVAVGGLVGAGLGAGSAALTGEDIGKGALMGGVGGAVSLGLGNLASKTISGQAAQIFSKSTATYIGEIVGQGIGDFAGGLATGASVKDSATMAALGAALGAYSASEINAADAAKIANKKREVAKGLLEKANKAIYDAEYDVGAAKYYLDLYQTDYVSVVYYGDNSVLNRLYDSERNYNKYIKNQKTSGPAATKAKEDYIKSYADFEEALIKYNEKAEAFSKSETELVSANTREVEYEQTLKIASDKAAADKVIADKAAADAAKVAQDAVDRAAAEKAVADKAAADAAKVAQDAAEKAAATKAAADKVIADKAAADAAKVAQDAAEKTAAAKAIADKAIADKAIADKAVADATAAAERAAAEHAAAVKALEDKVAADKVISDKAAADQAAAEKIAADKLASDKVAADKVASDKAAFDKGIADQAAAEEKAAADKVAFDKAAAERFITAEERPVRLKEIKVSAKKERPRRLGETITVSAKRERPRGFGALTQDYQIEAKMPMGPIKEPGTTEVPKKTSILGDALTLATLIPGMVGTGGQQGIPLPQGGLQGGLTASGTPGPGSSALAQVLNQGGAGAPVFGTNQDKGKKSKWNLESLRYMGNQDKGE
jgi:hypothetical protein